jgi:hypothetical protein
VTRARFSILRWLHLRDHFESQAEVEAFERRLAVACATGIVAETPALRDASIGGAVWYRDRVTRAVFRYERPDFPFRGHWGPVYHPDAPSAFAALAPSSPTQAQVDALLGQLDALVRSGKIREVQNHDHRPSRFFIDVATGEQYRLYPVIPELGTGDWAPFAGKVEKG